MPDQVVMKRGDLDLFVDWNKPILIRSFWHQARKFSAVTFEEFPYTAGSPVQEVGQSFANELILCFHSQMKK